MTTMQFRIRLFSMSVAIVWVATIGVGCRKALSHAEPVSTAPATTSEEQSKFQGTWKQQSMVNNGKVLASAVAKEFIYRFEGTQYTNARNGRVLSQGTFTLDPTKSPPWIDLAENSGMKIYGIYRFEGGKQSLCLHEQQRPTEFESQSGQGRMLVLLEQEKP